MKTLHVIGLLAGILFLSNTCNAQVILPAGVIHQIARELEIKDYLTYVLKLKDSTITIYEHKDSINQEIVRTYKMEIAEFNKVVKHYDELLGISEAEKKDLKSEILKLKLKFALWKVVSLAVIAALTYFLIKD